MLLFIAFVDHYWLLENCWGNLKFIIGYMMYKFFYNMHILMQARFLFSWWHCSTTLYLELAYLFYNYRRITSTQVRVLPIDFLPLLRCTDNWADFLFSCRRCRKKNAPPIFLIRVFPTHVLFPVPQVVRGWHLLWGRAAQDWDLCL
jgi:hypothetical protein